MAEKMLDPASLEARMKYGKPEDRYGIENEEKGLMSRLGQAIQETGEAFGLDRAAARKLGSAAELAGESAPIVGDVNDAYEFKRAAEEGDVTGMALSSLGFIPFVGGYLKRGGEKTIEAFKGADKIIQRDAIREASVELGRIPNVENPTDVEVLVDAAARAETNRMDNARELRKRTIYHSNKTGDADIIEEEGLEQDTHTILRGTTRDTSSFSSDPIFSARHFGNDDAGNIFEYNMSKEEADNLRNVTPAEMERAAEVMDDRYYGGDDDKLGVKLPEFSEYGHESETALFDVDKARLTRLKSDDPEKYAQIQEGIELAKKVEADQTQIVQTLVKAAEDDVELSPAEARKLYTEVRDNLKEGLSLAKYTSDNSARGAYDWYIRGWSDRAPMPVEETEIDYNEVLQQALDMDEDLASAYADIISETPDISDKAMVEELQQYDDWGTLSEFMDGEPDWLGDGPEAYDTDQVAAGLLKLQDSLVGEQNKEMVGKLIESIGRYEARGKWGVRGKKIDGKEGIIPTTERMAKGGFVTRRTSS